VRAKLRGPAAAHYSMLLPQYADGEGGTRLRGRNVSPFSDVSPLRALSGTHCPVLGVGHRKRRCRGKRQARRGARQAGQGTEGTQHNARHGGHGWTRAVKWRAQDGDQSLQRRVPLSLLSLSARLALRLPSRQDCRCRRCTTLPPLTPVLYPLACATEKPKLPDDFQAVTWAKLRAALVAIHRHQPVAFSFEELYRVRTPVKTRAHALLWTNTRSRVLLCA
jgi:hypothetical protein